MLTMTKEMFEEAILCTKASNPSSRKVLVSNELIRSLVVNYPGKVAYTSSSNNGVSTNAIEVKVGNIIFVCENSKLIS